ncbi:MAG: hypothetical protein U0Q18_03215 [Bryobacteraceae bacterium]
MSLVNFTEIAKRIGDPRFLLQKKIEQRIHTLHPQEFIGIYPMIAFTQMPYAKAYRASARAVPYVAARGRWDGNEVGDRRVRTGEGALARGARLPLTPMG